MCWKRWLPSLNQIKKLFIICDVFLFISIYFLINRYLYYRLKYNKRIIMLVTKEQKRNFVEWFEGVICSPRLLPYTNGQMIRSFHMSSPFIFFLMSSIGPPWMIYITIAFLITITSFFIIFGGCVLSMLETKLCQDKFNILHPLMEYYSIVVHHIQSFILIYINIRHV